MSHNFKQYTMKKMYQADTKRQKILFVDDEPINIEIFKLNFGARFEIHSATSGEEALKMFHENSELGVIVTDQKMPGMSGVELLSQLYNTNPDTIRIIVTAFTEFENVIEAINHGRIYHYVLKPWDPMRLGMVLEQGVYQWKLTCENKRLVEEQTEMNKKLQLLSKKLVHAQEEERKRISMDLHDDIGQNLIALKLQVGNLSSLVDRSRIDDDVREAISTLRDTLQLTIDNTRALSQNLSPAIIEEFGFDLALKEFLDSFGRNYNIEIVSVVVELENSFGKEALHQLYRIVQEIFNNIGKHSGTDRIHISVECNGPNCHFEIVDFGCGFEKEEPAVALKNRGLGFTTIRERVSVLGGNIDIDSYVDKGTRYYLSFPLDL